MSWKVSDITKTFDVVDPESGDTASVTIKRMAEGDRLLMTNVIHDLPDDMNMVEYAIELRKWRISHSVTEWDIPLKVAEADQLDPRVIEDIDEQIQLHNPGIFPAAMTALDKATKAEMLANTVDAYLEAPEGADELTEALAAYRGHDSDGESVVNRPTVAP